MFEEIDALFPCCNSRIQMSFMLTFATVVSRDKTEACNCSIEKCPVSIQGIFNHFCRSESPHGLEVYLHALQLLTTIDEGLQTFGKDSHLLHLPAAA